METIVQALQLARRGYLIAPAGCGKTEIIVNAISGSSGRQLILTHTHAGVDSLRKRLRKLGVSGRQYHIDTIASWSYRLCHSYPQLSKIIEEFPMSNEDWNKVYEGTLALLGLPFIKEVIRNSYTAVYIDEYQDCTVIQHNIVLKLSTLLDIKLLGDPLQGIFDFNGEIVNWESDIFPYFDKLPELEVPWRWLNANNNELGTWLLEVRERLIKNQPVNLTTAPKSVSWHRLVNFDDYTALIKHCINGLRLEGNVMIIHQTAAQCHLLAMKLGGRYKSMDEMQANDLIQRTLNFQSTTGRLRAKEVIDFISKSMTKVSTELLTIRKQLSQDKAIHSIKYPEIAEQIKQITIDDSFAHILRLMEIIENTFGIANIYRAELWFEMKRSIKYLLDCNLDKLSDAAWLVRNKTRVIGRIIPSRSISRTLLVKGLEFEHVIIVDADKFNTKNLYVALTRASKSISIWSKTSILNS